ncbi:hypothetical protein Tco_0345704 [Tanacetum coccineum]
MPNILKISSIGSEIIASYEDCLDGEVKEGKLRLEKLVEVPMYSPMEVRKVGRECKKDDEKKMRMSSFYRRILRRRVDGEDGIRTISDDGGLRHICDDGGTIRLPVGRDSG